MTYLVKGKIKGSGGRGKEKLEIRNVNVRSITLTENGCASPEDRVLREVDEEAGAAGALRLAAR